MKIRKATKNDLDGIYEVYKDFDESLTKLLPKKFKSMRKKKKPEEKYSKNALLKDIRKRKALFLVAEDNNKIVGYSFAIYLKPKSSFLDLPMIGSLEDIAVKKNQRGKGIASLLWTKTEEYLKEKNCEVIQLQVIHNNPAVKIYEKWGFEPALLKMRKKL